MIRECWFNFPKRPVLIQRPLSLSLRRDLSASIIQYNIFLLVNKNIYIRETELKDTPASKRLNKELASWHHKSGLRAVYADSYRKILSQCVPGNTVEIGSGSGNFKRYAPQTIATDIVEVPWIDVVTDAVTLPFRQGAVSNLIGFDVLHHIEYPTQFFEEAGRVLKHGGRLIFCEPAITPLSRFFYKYFHSEPLDLTIDPFVLGAHDPCREPFDANQAIPTLLFLCQYDRFHEKFPELRIKDTRLTSLLAYPLSGGFRQWSLLPDIMASPLLRLESFLLPIVGKYMAFRMLVVVEKV